MAATKLDKVAKPSLQKLDVKSSVIDIVEEFQFGEFVSPVNLTGSGGINDTDDFFYEQLFGDTNAGVFEQADRIITLYGIPLTIAIGCLGNTLSFIVFVFSHLRIQSSSVYLAFLNAVDTLFLLCLLVAWFDRVDIRLVSHHGVCQTVMYFSYVGAFLSVYTVAGFTVERWIIVFHPLRKNDWCTRRRALIIITTLTAIAMLLYTFWFWTTGLVEIPNTDYRVCHPRPQFYTLVQILSSVDTVITLVIPSIIIIVLNVSISKKVMEFAQKENALLNNNSTSRLMMSHLIDNKHGIPLQEMGSLCYVRKPSQAISSVSTFSFKNLTLSKSGKHRGFRKRVQLRTTRSLLIVSTVFVSLNLPSHAFRIYAVLMEISNGSYVFSKTSLLWQNLLQMVYYANFSANFFLYSACSKSFRLAFRRLCVRVKHSVMTKWNKFDMCNSA